MDATKPSLMLRGEPIELLLKEVYDIARSFFLITWYMRMFWRVD